jgi:hypothetical protein
MNNWHTHLYVLNTALLLAILIISVVQGILALQALREKS